VLESTRAKEQAVKKETAEQLELFKQQQEKTEKAARGEVTEDKPVEEITWTVGNKKRKRVKDKEAFPGVKLRKSSSTAETIVTDSTKSYSAENKEDNTKQSAAEQQGLVSKDKETVSKSTTVIGAGKPQEASASPGIPSLGLGGYSSDED
jgi:hypothetical protein